MTWCLFSMRYYYPVYKKDKVNCTLDRPMLNILLYVIINVLSDGDVILRILWMYKYHSTLHTWEKFPSLFPWGQEIHCIDVYHWYLPANPANLIIMYTKQNCLISPYCYCNILELSFVLLPFRPYISLLPEEQLDKNLLFMFCLW